MADLSLSRSAPLNITNAVVGDRALRVAIADDDPWFFAASYAAGVLARGLLA